MSNEKNFFEMAIVPVEHLLKKIDNGDIKLEPSKDDTKEWTEKRKSNLIGDMITGISIGYVIVDKENDGSNIVRDWENRCKAISEFINNEFCLTGFSGYMSKYEGKRYDLLDEDTQKRIKLYPLMMYYMTEPDYVLRK